MLRGVLSGSPASAPVFVFDLTTDIKPSPYIAVRYNLGGDEGSFRMRLAGLEVTAWRGRIMVLAYKHPEEQEQFTGETSASPVGGGRIRRRYEHERAEPREEMDDFTVLARALQEREARLYFNVRLWSRSAFYEHQATATLTTVGKRDLQVWFDRVLEQQQG